MSSIVSASQVVTGQVQSLDSVRSHALPSDAMIFASGTKVQPANQNPGSFSLVESANALTLTTTGSVPVVTQSPFADLYKEGSLYFGGVAGNYVSGTATGLMGTQWNTTGLTIEAWVNYPTFTGASISPGGAVSQPYLVGQFQPAAATDYWGFGSNTLGYVCFFYYNGSAVSINATVPLSTNTWNHIAFSCVPGGTTANIYVNGTSVASTSISGTPTVSGSIPLTLGQYNSNSPCLNAYVADVRITTGAALYTGSSFTVPSAPLSPAATGVAQALIRAGQNSPTIQSGALTFDRGLKQFMNFGPQTFNLATRGFTAVFKYTWNGAVGNYERIFDIGVAGASPSYAYAVGFGRAGTGNQYYFYVNAPPPATTNPQATTAVGVMNQGTSYVVACRWSSTTGLADIWINGLFNCQSNQTPSPAIADFTSSWTALGTEISKTYWASDSLSSFAIYNRALSNVEILNAYSALTTATINAPIEIGDVNGTPALSIAGDGRVNVTKLGQTSNVVPWPPAAMTGYVTSINGQNYVASASSDNGANFSWMAFDKNTNNIWVAASAGYSTAASPYPYTGSYTTTDVNGTVYPGEWLQIQLPNQVTLSSYIITPSGTTTAAAKFFILGSRDGVNWFQLDSRSFSGWASNTPSTFTLATPATQAFSYFRISINQLNGNGGNAVMNEWTLYGTADTAQTLTVAQPVTLSYGAQTASLTGIAGDKYVPQDFSSSGLNIPAYVVSNTATVANTVQYSSFGPFAGEGSVYFPNGTGPYYGTYVNFPSSAPVCFDWTTLDFTIELWFYPTAFSQGGANAGGIFKRITWPVSTYQFEMTISNSGVVQFYDGASGAAISPSGAATLNAWNHISACVSGSTAYVSLNGVVGSAAKGSFTYNSALGFVISSGIPSNSGWSGVNGYISNFRVVRGIGLYTSAFTPPTAPLQPIQGTTQAGTPYGTVLLLRNAPAPGRVLTSKFSGQNSSTVLPFPPAAMTGYSTTLNSGYGQGTYVASASNEFDSSGNALWRAFDKNTSTLWTGDGSSYTSGNYVKSPPVTTVDVNGTSYTGEWIQLQMPSSIVLSNYQINSPGSQGPSLFYLLGSRDGFNWFLVDSRSGQIPNSTYLTYPVSSGQAFAYFRLVTNKIYGGNSYVQILELVFNGTIEGPNVTPDGRLGVGVSAPVQALEVGGSAVVTGTLSAGNPITFRNRIINGDMRINQRGATSITSSAYLADRFVYSTSTSSIALTYQTLAASDAPYQTGIKNSIRCTATTGVSLTAGYVYAINQQIEGYNIVDFNWGTSYASPVTASFWFRSNMPAGSISSFTFRNGLAGGGWALYNTTFTVTGGGAWQYVTLTIPPPPSGSGWNSTNGVGIEYLISSIYNTGAPLGWSTSASVGYSGQYTWWTTTGNYVEATGVQLEKGTVATPFEVRPYGVELQLCQRYYEKSYASGTAAGTNTVVGMVFYGGFSDPAASFGVTIRYSVPKRATTTPTIYSPTGTVGQMDYAKSGGGATVAAVITYASEFSFTNYCNIGTAYTGATGQFHWAASAEL